MNPNFGAMGVVRGTKTAVPQMAWLKDDLQSSDADGQPASVNRAAAPSARSAIVYARLECELDFGGG